MQFPSLQPTFHQRSTPWKPSRASRRGMPRYQCPTREVSALKIKVISQPDVGARVNRYYRPDRRRADPRRSLGRMAGQAQADGRWLLRRLRGRLCLVFAGQGFRGRIHPSSVTDPAAGVGWHHHIILEQLMNIDYGNLGQGGGKQRSVPGPTLSRLRRRGGRLLERQAASCLQARIWFGSGTLRIALSARCRRIRARRRMKPG